MNILAATTDEEAKDQVYNVAVGDRTTLNELFSAIQGALKENHVNAEQKPIYRDLRAGDVRHSQADISKVKTALNYAPEYRIMDGIEKAMPWYISFLG